MLELKRTFKGREFGRLFSSLFDEIFSKGGLDLEAQYDLHIQPHRMKRSREANSYLWVLCSKIGSKLSVGGITKTPEDVYRDLIPDVGENFDIICIQNKAVDDFRRHWSEKGVGWVTDIMDSKIEGCTNVICYYGSSCYDSLQMSRLINLAVQEAKQLDIETLPPNELKAMLEDWGK